MAILRYKKDGDPNKIREMPVISSVYTEYVILDTQYVDPEIELTPSVPTQSRGAGAYEGITASVKFVSDSDSRNTYIPSASAQTFILSDRYGSSGFPRKINIAAIPSNWLNKNTEASTPPANTTISLPSGTITIPAGYYSSNVVVDCDIVNKGSKTIELTPSVQTVSDTAGYYTSISASVKTLQNNPIYTPTTSTQNITYTSTGFPKGITINPIPTITLNLTSNNTTYTIGSGSWTAGTYPTSIYVNVPSSTPTPSTPPSNTTITAQNGSITIDAGYYDDDIIITASLPSAVAPTDKTISSPSETKTISAGYLSSPVTISSDIINNGAPGAQTLAPNTQSYYSVSSGYYSSGFTVSPNTQTLTILNPTLTKNGSYYTKTYSYGTGNGSGSSWGDKYLTSFTIEVPESVANNIVSGTSVCGIAGTYPAGGIIDSGTVSGSVKWKFYDSGKILYIYGSGTIPNYPTLSNQPWYDYRYSVQEIHIGDEITSIGEYAFMNLNAVQKIIIGSSVHTIGQYAFFNCGGNYTEIRSLYIPASVNSIGSCAFGYYDALFARIQFGGTPNSLSSSAFYGTGFNAAYVPWYPSDKTFTSIFASPQGTPADNTTYGADPKYYP